jgi:hypothetical protein
MATAPRGTQINTCIPDKYHLRVIRVTKGWYALVPKPGAARHPLLNDGIPNGNLNHWPVRSREPYKV